MSNKENITANKFEGPVLKMEPMSMKKKKKGGGYNLRKSIAWNQAFFTEEGVLDPEELSLLSGTQVSSSTEEISTRKLETMDSINEDDEFIDDSANHEELEKHSFRRNPSVGFQEEKETGYLPLKHTSPACSSKASHKVTPHAKRTGFVSGASPSPLPSSSLKRPASVNSCKPVSEASKIPKVPVSKPRNLSFLSSIKSNTSGTASSMKNQILRPVAYKQRVLESNSSKRSVNTPKKKTREGSDTLSVKSSALHVKRNKLNPPLNLPAPTQLCLNTKVIQEKSLHTGEEDLPEHHHANARPVDFLPSKNVITGRALQQSKVQSNKPSGLRKPSPSLGYFDQSKASSSNRFSRRDVGSLPRVEALGDKRPPAKHLQVLNSNVPRANTPVSSLRNDSSFQSNISSRSSDDLAEAEKNGKENLDKREDNPSSDEQVIHITCSEDGKNRNEISSEVDRGVVVKLLVTGPCKDFSKDVNVSDCVVADKPSGESIGETQVNSDQCDADVAEPKTTAKSPCKEEKSCKLAATEHDFAIDAVSNSEVLSSAMSSSASLSCVSDLQQQPPSLGDDLQTTSDEKYAVPNVYIPVLEKANYEKLIEYPHSSEGRMIGDNILKIEESELELQGSSYTSESPCASQSEDSIIRGYLADSLGQELQIPGLPLNGNIRGRRVHQSSETEDLRNLSATQVELQADFLKVEYDSKNVEGLPSAGGLLIEKYAYSEENQKNIIETSPLVLSDIRGKSEIDDSDTLMSDVFNGVKVEESLTNKVSRLDLPESGSCPASCRNFSSVAHLSGEPSSLNVLSCSSEVSIMEDSRTCDESKSAGQVEISQTSLILESSDEDQIPNLQSVVETDPTLHARSLIEWEKHCRTSEVLDVMEADSIPTKLDNEGNYSETEDNSGFSALDFEPVLTISPTSVWCDEYVGGANHITVEPCQPALLTCSMLDTEVPDDKIQLLPRNYLNEEITEPEKYAKSFASVCGAHNISHERESCESDLRSFNPISATTTLTFSPAQVNMDDETERNEVACIEDQRFGSEILPYFATSELSGGSKLLHDAQSGGSLFQRNSTSPDGKYKSVGPTVSTSINEIQPEVYENMDCLVQDTKCDFITCLDKDEKDTSPLSSEKSKETSNGRNLTIIPPKNAVPFSDEWLAAIEAAGEDILTMKSGAVQNSPTDKSVPEPSPWSPVKKKNIPIGPYDCTKKFMNN